MTFDFYKNTDNPVTGHWLICCGQPDRKYFLNELHLNAPFVILSHKIPFMDYSGKNMHKMKSTHVQTIKSTYNPLLSIKNKEDSEILSKCLCSDLRRQYENNERDKKARLIDHVEETVSFCIDYIVSKTDLKLSFDLVGVYDVLMMLVHAEKCGDRKGKELLESAPLSKFNPDELKAILYDADLVLFPFLNKPSDSVNEQAVLNSDTIIYAPVDKLDDAATKLSVTAAVQILKEYKAGGYGFGRPVIILDDTALKLISGKMLCALLDLRFVDFCIFLDSLGLLRELYSDYAGILDRFSYLAESDQDDVSGFGETDTGFLFNTVESDRIKKHSFVVYGKGLSPSVHSM